MFFFNQPGTKIRVTVWNENWDETRFENVRTIYPNGIHHALKGFLSEDPMLAVETATPKDPDFGLSERLLAQTDVLVWWGHVIHHLVPDEAVDRVCRRVMNGMGLIFLHSAAYSKPFQRLVGSMMNSAYREIGEKERVWAINPAHEIATGIPAYFELPHSEVYREPTGLPMPDELVFLSWYAGGEASISGSCYFRGRGRIFMFTPGHEDFPIFYDANVQHIIANGIKWAFNPYRMPCQSGEVPALESLDEAKLIRIHKQRNGLPKTLDE